MCTALSRRSHREARIDRARVKACPTVGAAAPQIVGDGRRAAVEESLSEIFLELLDDLSGFLLIFIIIKLKGNYFDVV